MAGNRIGGAKAAAANKKKDPDFYRKIGRLGGIAGNTGGFASSHELAVSAGRKGGLSSKRGKSEKTLLRAKLAKKLLAQGVSVNDIAKEIGVTNSTIYTYLREY